ncbi:hypothetical protein [Paraburkholderia sp. MM5384-R2]|uniref:hypothetical protein n=1 Tax=Paraburkholderia sp. MM5384-R2 TaxID=2723097 RepID=UPI0016132FAF|nr:hypothetical protein [Paraburkholderia sp. MM5384-R2]MBB5498702.1 hypothetical protein [Paraburkholderia sp. MM5384-R2]
MQAALEFPTRKGYKWIAREIESLDPEVHYERIWALSTTYYVDDMFMNILYTTGIQCFTQPPAGSVIMGQITKKAITKKQKRTDDTLQHFWKWFEFGPSNPDARRSLAHVNSVHQALSKKAPGTFPARDVIYTTAWIGADMHRLRLSLGLPGYTEKQKIATQRYWAAVSRLFWSEDGYITDYPESFEAMLIFLEDYEAQPWEQVQSGKELAEALTQQYMEAWFPLPFRALGRQVILSLQKPVIRKLMQMGDPNPIAKWAIRKAFWLIIMLKERVLPDPKLSTPEKARRRNPTPSQHLEPPKAKAGGCPFHASMSDDQ